MQIPIKELEGRDHFVIPTVMLTVGIHSGSGGPVFYPAPALQQSARLWNGKPVVVYHPAMAHGGFADSPHVFSRQKVGHVFNTRFDGRRLTAEAWIDVERVARVDERVLDAIRSRRMMEVSTGLEIQFAEGGGVYNGKHHLLAARSLHPDHLAILPDQIGACSIADGAGLLRNELCEEALESVTI